MREIKFRAWDNVHLKWVYFTLAELINGKAIKSLHLSNWCQFTDLKDKNSKEVFEGDIVTINTQRRAAGSNTNWYRKSSKQDTNVIARCSIIYKAPEFRINWDTEYNSKMLKPVGLEKDDRELIHWYLTDFNKIEIIGNIYENPELLKEPK